MRVNVDKARGNDASIRIYDPLRIDLPQTADGSYATVLDCHIGQTPRGSRAINNTSISDEQVEVLG
jgi:hypothetical protein